MELVSSSPRTLMLIHGWGESGGVFDRLIEMLPPSLRPAAIDLPGHGAAPAAADGYSVRDLAGHLATVLEDLNSSAEERGKGVVLDPPAVVTSRSSSPSTTPSC